MKLVLGEEYERPTIQGIPVITPGHDDKELPCVKGNEIYHFHYDWRFINAVPKMNAAIMGCEPKMYLHRCWRTQHPWNPGLIFATHTLMLRYRDACVKSGRCPHRGAEIDSVTGQCPAHGLLFDLNTGKLKHDPDQLEYKVGASRVKCRGDSFEATIDEPCRIDRVQMMAGDTVIAEHLLNGPVQFGPGDRFKFVEECEDYKIQMETQHATR